MTLRPPRPSDVGERLALGRDPEIAQGFGADPLRLPPLTKDEVERQLAPSPHSWVIDFGGRFIGTARLHSLVSGDRRASFAIGIFDPRMLSQGLGTEATRLVLEHAFATLHLHRVALRVLADNARAIRCYEKCGFVREGRERESARVGDRWVDDIIMGIVEGETRP